MDAMPEFLQYGAFGLLALVLAGVGYGLSHYIGSVERRQAAWDEHDRERRKDRVKAEWNERMEYIGVIKEVSNSLAAMTAEMQAHEGRANIRFQELITNHHQIRGGVSDLARKRD